MAAKIQKGAANGCPNCISPQEHMAFAPQSQRKSRPVGRHFRKKLQFGVYLQRGSHLFPAKCLN